MEEKPAGIKNMIPAGSGREWLPLKQGEECE